MTSKRYLAVIAVTLLGLVGPFILYNFLADDFGLFWSTSPKRIWTLEKTSKYLMSFRYIPRNFDGLLIGPSYSDGLMDTHRIGGYRIYNLSMDGANATELRTAAANALDRGHFRVMVICMTPYLTKDSGIKGSQINAKEYWGSLFSLLPLQILQARLAVHRHATVDYLAGSDWGNANEERPLYTWEGLIQSERDDPLERELRLDPSAYRDLRAIIDAAHRHGARVYAYFFPNSVWRSETAIASGEWQRYRTQALALFDPQQDVVWDMMGPEYLSLRSDPTCYTDGHLSVAGANLVLADIEHHLDPVPRGINRPPIFPPGRPFACLGLPGGGSGYDRQPQAASSSAQ